MRAPTKLDGDQAYRVQRAVDHVNATGEPFEELALCPFCGSAPTFIHHSNCYFDGDKLLSLGCCGFRKAGKYSELIKAWNKRA